MKNTHPLTSCHGHNASVEVDIEQVRVSSFQSVQNSRVLCVWLVWVHSLNASGRTIDLLWKHNGGTVASSLLASHNRTLVTPLLVPFTCHTSHPLTPSHLPHIPPSHRPHTCHTSHPLTTFHHLNLLLPFSLPHTSTPHLSPSHSLIPPSIPLPFSLPHSSLHTSPLLTPSHLHSTPFLPP